MAGFGDLARQDDYTPPADVDWSKYNQPMGELKNPIAYRTPYFNVYRSTVDNANDLWNRVGQLPTAMGAILGMKPQR